MNLQSKHVARLADESARTGHPVEWWFVQGRFEGEGVEPREFMVSLFRHALEWGGLSAGNSCSLMVSILDPKTGQCRTLSQIDPATTSFLVMAAKISPPAGLDPLVMAAVTEEIERYGPPGHIRVAKKKARLASKPFRATWGDFELSQHDGGFDLRFEEPETGRLFSFRLEPMHPRIHLPAVEVPGGGAMDYVSYTRMSLGGEVDGCPVRGQAWFDHQWGSQGWFVAGSKQERILGWDWLGIQLDDGRELMVVVHRDQRSGETLCQYAVEVGADGSQQVHREFRLVPLAWWTSFRTGARYPVRWRMQLPDAGIDLVFEPFAEDQEIPVLPPIRAVWEGAGRVSGTCSGKSVSGWARLELHGYAYLLDLEEFLDQFIQRIHGHIEAFIPRAFTELELVRWAGTPRGRYDAEAQSAMISRPLWDLIDRGGKHWRPIFGILMLGAMGVDPVPYESLITITSEILHDAALIIDDIQDHGQKRRGDECIHLRYGVDVAINAANTAYFMPMVLLRDYPGLSDLQKLELYHILSRLFIGAHFGQSQDIYWSKNLTPERLRAWMADDMEAKILQLYTQKTAAVVEASAEGAAVIAGAAAPLQSACANFGRTLGIAFQMVNDIVDFSESRVQAGDGGSDLREGKITYAVLRALQRLSRKPRERLEAILCSPALRQDDLAIAEGIELVRRSGAIEICRKEARRMVEDEWKSLSNHLPPSEAKQMLRVLWTFLLTFGDQEGYAGYAPGN
ncbi:MAG: polyprenyl synthetase family protein [Verrucomicrobiae bacterium]